MKKFLSCTLPALILAFSAQAQVNVYENPGNLKVLPPDISASELLEVMKGFAIGTGFRCSSCHVGEEGQPFTEYDFASDEKQLKRSARAMLQMVNTINGTIRTGLGDDRTEVRCITCHRGVNQPRLTGEVLTEAAESGGIEELKQTYASLRDRYHGTHSYDFSDMTLSDFALSRAAAGETEQAEAMFALLLEDNPKSFMGHWRYGEMMHRAGNTEKAVHHYRKAIEANPGAGGFLQPRIDQLLAPAEPE
ncbi:MAG: c-type cytochrome [Xanthomonadales bacterium]|nr:c-type cytochrome [Xanthomonadales bacterium]NNL96315.1 c-type cytochrome [Xanthomonadales bacterium]